MLKLNRDVANSIGNGVNISAGPFNNRPELSENCFPEMKIKSFARENCTT